MPEDFITIGQTGPSPEEDIADGSYIVICTDIGQVETTETPGSPYGDTFTFRKWKFKVNQQGPYLGREVEAALTPNSGPKSNTYAYITALNGGQAPQPKQQFGLSDLVGRQAIATIYHKDDGGFPKIKQLSAIPQAMLQQQFAAATAAPNPTPAAPVASAPAATDDLPF